MNLKEAIEYLQELKPQPWLQGFPYFVEAVGLGIVALKWRLQIEQEDPEIELEPLPGETKE